MSEVVDLWHEWTPVVPVVVLALAYAAGWRRARLAGDPRLTGAHPAACACGLAVLAAAVAPPFDEVADDLLVAHMAQHMVLALVVPVPLVLGRPGVVLGALLGPAGGVRGLGARAHAWLEARPAVWVAGGLALHLATFLSWHVPALYDAALADERVHAVEHATLLLGGLALASALVDVGWGRKPVLGLGALFGATVATGVLGALLTLAPSPLYDAHLLTAPGRGLTPLEDQQLAGGSMWVVGGVLYLAAAVVIVVRWLEAGPRSGAVATDALALGEVPTPEVGAGVAGAP
jgi:putative membrane protein